MGIVTFYGTWITRMLRFWYDVVYDCLYSQHWCSWYRGCTWLVCHSIYYPRPLQGGNCIDSYKAFEKTCEIIR